MVADHYICPNGNIFSLPIPMEVRVAIRDPSDPFWRGANGSLQINLGTGRSLLVTVNARYGVYLKLFPEGRTEEYLSLHDSTEFSEWVKCEEDWYASASLFVPGDVALLAVDDFIRDGLPSSRIRWIRPSELPEEANW